MDKQKLKSVIESLLFVSGEPVKMQKLAKICEVAKNEVETAIDELSGELGANRGLRIIRKGDLVQLATSSENAEYANRLVKSEMNSELSRSALETLSIVAFRGPITRIQIESIRGVNCSYVLRNLLLRGIIERKETTDIRGYLYEISFDFLKNLGIQSVKELPDWEELSKNEKVAELLSVDETTISGS
jgi:segregation and condensation protein B